MKNTQRSLPTERIDALLTQSGWEIKSKRTHPGLEGKAIALRNIASTVEQQHPYLLAINEEAVGLIHITPAPESPKGDELDNMRLPAGLQKVSAVLPYRYYSDGTTITFINLLEGSRAQMRRVGGIHQPRTLARWLTQANTHSGKSPFGSAQGASLSCIRTHPIPQASPHIVAVLEKLNYAPANWSRTLFLFEPGIDRLSAAYATAERLVQFGGTRRLLFLVHIRSEQDNSCARELRKRLTSASTYKLGEAFVFVCDLGYMRTRLSTSPPLPIESFDTVILYDYPTDGKHFADYQQVLSHFDAVVIGFTSGNPQEELLALFDGNAFSISSPNKT